MKHLFSSRVWRPASPCLAGEGCLCFAGSVAGGVLGEQAGREQEEGRVPEAEKLVHA